ncbi:MAG: UDP-N-acetylmuramate dehydrogenase [Desulfomonilia bacterium]|nr:UDP-N-acetylmuramate dehydrogenase [Desulfomonilia bacterium]
MKSFSDIPAREVTSMHCGGTLKTVYEPEDVTELLELIAGLDDFVVLGGGTNTIFEEAMIQRPIIRLGKGFAFIEHQGEQVSAGGAVPVKHLVGFCIRSGLSGIEFLAGIPGLVGGAVAMNAGTPIKGILDSVDSIELADKKGVHATTRDRLSYGYRNGGIPPHSVVTRIVCRLEERSPEEVRQTIRPYLEKKRLQPRGYSSGSIFKNPAEKPAGMLIEQAGLKGYRIGGARVSEVHANFIINDGTASTTDIKSLIDTVKTRVRDVSGIDLIEEVRIIG